MRRKPPCSRRITLRLRATVQQAEKIYATPDQDDRLASPAVQWGGFGTCVQSKPTCQTSAQSTDAHPTLPPRTIPDNTDANGSQIKPLPSLQTQSHGPTRIKGRLGPEDTKRPDSDCAWGATTAQGQSDTTTTVHQSCRFLQSQDSSPESKTRRVSSQTPMNAVHSLPLLYGPGQGQSASPQ